MVLIGLSNFHCIVILYISMPAYRQHHYCIGNDIFCREMDTFEAIIGCAVMLSILCNSFLP